MRINHNIAALNTYRQLTINNTAGSKSLEKLSSGFRINRAGDDAAGLAISEKMRGQIRGLNQAERNSQDAISLIQTAEGALNETHSILQRMRELAVQAASDTNTDDDRAELQKEIEQLTDEITRISQQTEFNTKKLLNGSFGMKLDADSSDVDDLITTQPSDPLNADKVLSGVDVSGAKAGTTYTISETATTIKIEDQAGNVQIMSKDGLKAGSTINFDKFGISLKTNENYKVGETDLDGKTIVTPTNAEGATFQIGANRGQTVSLSLGDMSADGLNIKNIDLTTQDGASAAIDAINDAITRVSSERSMLGAMQNRLEHTINNLGTTAENLTASESRIRDVDMAKEMMEFTKNSILQQAATAMLAQANQQPQGVLQLLQ